MENNELVEIPATSNGIMVAREPAIVLAEAKKAASALMTVVAQKKKPVIINGEQYLEFEDWQTAARFYGISVRVTKTTLLDLGGVRGYEATAEAIRNSDGMIISSADAMCLNDEEKWSSRAKYEYIDGKREKTGEIPVPLFQLRSMAQTRACAKALRNVLAWVVVLAGFKPTPAEEMTDGLASAPISTKPRVETPKEKPAPVETSPDTVTEVIPDAGINVIEALTQPVGATFDMWGVLFQFSSRKVNTSKGQSDITDYELSPRESTQIIKVSIFGLPPTGLVNGSIVTLKGVKSKLYNGNITYLAQSIEIIE